MIQSLAVGILFLGAVAYLVYRFGPTKTINHEGCDDCN